MIRVAAKKKKKILEKNPSYSTVRSRAPFFAGVMFSGKPPIYTAVETCLGPLLLGVTKDRRDWLMMRPRWEK